MFSSIDPIHIVFANEGDTYFCNSLMKLNLNRYLWLTLHEKYKSVYFMEDRDGSCHMYTYGDTAAKNIMQEEPKSGGFLFKKPKGDNVKSRILRELEDRNDNASAFVCSIFDFCNLFKDESDKDLLNSIVSSRKRSGIIVLTAPPEIDLTRDLFLNSPVFEYLKEPWVRSVRTSSAVRMYDKIKDTKSISCVNLNYFTKERIKNVLNCIMIEDDTKYLSVGDLQKVIDYLYQYLNDWNFRVYETTLPDNQLDYRTRYSDLYGYCKDKSTWKKLVDRSLKFNSQEELRQYLDSLHCQFREDIDVFKGKNFYRAPNSYAEGIIRYCSTNNFNHISGTDELVRYEVLRLISDLRKEVVHVRSGTENAKIAAKADSMVTKLSTYSGYKDYISNIYTLRALKFVVNNITTPDGTEKEKDVIKIAEEYDAFINTSLSLFIAEHDLDAARRNASGTLSQKVLEMHQ